ncbi:MAG: adenylate/guanylate cyclase domain-containing protein [Candidatus Hodarchaeales archaeon]|jgi:class 3 adenylate cyclase
MSDTTFLIDLQVKINELMSLKYDVSKIDRIPTKQDATFGDKACSVRAACLFIDIRNSTALLDKYRVSDVANLLKCFHYICSCIIKKNDGEVRSFNGDSVLAIFAEQSCCDCAVSCAFNIKYYLKSLLFSEYQIEKDLDFGIGIDYGDVFVVKVGNRGEFNNDLVWVGSSVNQAAKMSNNSKLPNNIRISDSVHKRLSDLNKFQPPRKPSFPSLPIPYGRKPEIWQRTIIPVPYKQGPIIYYSSYERA